MGDYTGVSTNGLVLTAPRPDDGSGVDAVDLNVVTETALDNDAYFATRGLIGAYAYTYDNASFILPEIFTTTSYVAATSVTIDVPNTKVGDILVIDLSGYVSFDALTGHTGDIRLKITEQHGGASPAVVNPAGARILAQSFTGAVTTPNGSFTCKSVVASAGTARVTIEGKVSNAGDNLYLVNVVTLRVLHMRTPV